MGTALQQVRRAAAAAVALSDPGCHGVVPMVYRRLWPRACCQTVLGSSVSVVSCDLSLCSCVVRKTANTHFVLVRSLFVLHACVAVVHTHTTSDTRASRVRHSTHGPPLAGVSLARLALGLGSRPLARDRYTSTRTRTTKTSSLKTSRSSVKVVFLGFGAVKSGKRGLLHTNFSSFDYD